MPGFNIGGGAGGNNEPNSQVEILRSHRWQIVTLGSPDIRINRATLLYAKSLSLPGFSVEEEVVNGASLKYKFAKMVNWEDVSIEFYDVVGVFDDLKQWQDKVWTPATGIQPANSYKFRASFALTDGTGFNDGAGVEEAFTLHGAWPKQLSHSPLSYESSELKLVSLVLSYDFVTFDLQ
jgi:hypothetical protein